MNFKAQELGIQFSTKFENFDQQIIEYDMNDQTQYDIVFD